MKDILIYGRFYDFIAENFEDNEGEIKGDA